jgi:PAS domain S-box-containing protein
MSPSSPGSPQLLDALRASEASYRTIFDASNDAIFVHDLATGAVLDANRTACLMSGVTREELMQRGVDIIGSGPPPFTVERALEHMRRAAAGEPQRFEWCSIRDDTGEEIWVEVGLQRVAIGGHDRLLALVRDIRERKAVEHALRASEEAYRTIFRHSSEAIWVHDVGTGAMLDVNDAGCQLYGYSYDEMMRLGHDALLYPGSAYTPDRIAEYMGLAIAGETPRFEWLGRHRDGSEVWGEVTLRRVTVSGGDRILATVRDIKDRKRAETALRRANEELERRVSVRTAELEMTNRALEESNRALEAEIAEREAAQRRLQKSEEHFRRLIENSSDYIMVVDATAAITYIGPSVEKMLGYTPAEMLGRRPVDLVHPDDVPGAMETLAAIIAHPGTSSSYRFRIRHRDGSWRYVENTGRTLSPESAADGIVVNGRDITERRAAEQALREAIGTAERANRAKSEFLGRMSHELRTPMNSILGFAQVLEGTGLDERQDRCVQHILRAGQHLLQLINEVLDIARIEAGHHNLSLEPVRLQGVVQEVLGLARPMAEQAGVLLEPPRLPVEDVYVHADRQRLAQVLLNLLSNAIKYNRAGGRVRVTCAGHSPVREAARIALRVEDTGAGIAPALHGELFTPFARLGAENSGIEGTGLGLALSQRLAEAMGGGLALERTGADGSVFRLELRPARSPLLDLQEDAPAPRRRAPIPHAPATLLYIEDNLANLSLVETILWERPEWRTIPALQGQIGVELAREHVPDLILLDLHLPDIRGDEVLRRLRADERTAAIPVVIISADATRAAAERLLAAGAAAFLTKPLAVAEFLSTLERLLAARMGSS